MSEWGLDRYKANPVLLIPRTLGQQTLNESIETGLLYALGLGGLYMLLRSTRFAYRPRHAYILLILGTVMVLLVVFYSNTFFISKITG